ncbi:MAG: dihydroneopterin aldolase [Sphingobacteriales bacterium]|nr:dihydroneopterin aldolase [Sphingobacteriales bacterium]
MNDLISIELNELRFRARHGLYPEEKKTGNEFEVNLTVSFVPVAGTITDIADTVDYGRLYELVKKEMNKPRHLLETLAMEITEIIHLSFPQIRKIEIAITKLQVPITQFNGTTTVKLEKEF